MQAQPIGTLSSWATFTNIAPTVGTSHFGFVLPLPDINRFNARFRAASAFRSVMLEGYSDTVIKGYTEYTRLLMTYSAFELLLKIVGKTQVTVRADLDAAGADSLLAELRELDEENAFYHFIYARVNSAHQAELSNYFANDPCNLAYLASAIRHIYAHGLLTPSANGGEPMVAAIISQKISNFLLCFMDNQFSKHVNCGMEELDRLCRRE